MEWEYISRNPAVLKHTFKLKRKRKTDGEQRQAVILSREQVLKFLDSAKDDYFYPAYLIAIFTGFRRGEILGLTWSDIDFKGGVINVEKAVQRLKGEGIDASSTKSDNSIRFAVVPASVLVVLRRHRKQQLETKALMGEAYHDEGWVFCRPDGKQWDPKTFSAHFKKLAKRMGLPAAITLHHLRHNYVTHRHDLGHDLDEISQDAGHGNVAVTRIYDHETYERKKKAALELEAWLLSEEPQAGRQTRQ